MRIFCFVYESHKDIYIEFCEEKHTSFTFSCVKHMKNIHEFYMLRFLRYISACVDIEIVGCIMHELRHDDAPF